MNSIDFSHPLLPPCAFWFRWEDFKKSEEFSRKRWISRESDYLNDSFPKNILFEFVDGSCFFVKSTFFGTGFRDMHVFRVEIGVALDGSGLYQVQNDQQDEIFHLKRVRRAESFD